MKKLAFLLMILGISVSVRANLYMADVISVSAEANTAVEARDLALNYAVTEAFPLMLRKVALSDASATIATPDEMSAMVQGLSIANEKTTATKYMADVSVQFKPQEVQEFLNRQSILYITKEPPKFLFIPIYVEGDKTQVFEGESPLFQAMKKGVTGSSIYDFVTPLGDEQDIGVVTPALLKGTDFSDLNQLLLRYRTDSALLMRVIKTGNVYKVQTKVHPQNSIADADVLFAVSSASANIPAVMAQVIKKTAGEMEKRWRATQTVKSDQKGEMIVLIPINGLAEWNMIEKQIKGLPFLDKMQVQALHQNKVFLKLMYSDSVENIVTKMGQAGFYLKNQHDNTWIWDKTGAATEGVI